MSQIGQTAPAAGAQDGIGSPRTDTGHAQEVAPPGDHDVNGGFAQVLIGPDPFGVAVKPQVALIDKGQVFDLPAVIPQEEAGFVEAALPDSGHSGEVLKRGLLDRLEAGEIGPPQAGLPVEAFGDGKQLEVGIADSADYKLGDHAGADRAGRAAAGRLPDLMRPAQHPQQIVVKHFARRQPAQTVGCGALKIDRNAIGELHGPHHLIVLRAGHDLEMHVALIGIAAPDDLDGVDQAILGPDAAVYHAGRQEDTLHQTGPLQRIEGAGQLVRLKRHPAHPAPASAERAVEAALLTGGGDHRP